MECVFCFPFILFLLQKNEILDSFKISKKKVGGGTKHQKKQKRKMSTKKILFAGTTVTTTSDEEEEDDTQERKRKQEISSLFERAKRVNEKAGPFEALFIVGDVAVKSSTHFSFGEEEGDDEEDEAAGKRREEEEKRRTKESVEAFLGCLREEEVSVKTFVLDLFLLERLKEREDGRGGGDVRLVDANEFDGERDAAASGGITNIEGLNPQGSVKRIVVDGKETNVFVVTKPGVYSTLIGSKGEEGNDGSNPFSVAILPGSYDHLNIKESHASAGNAMLAEKTAKANGEFTVQDVEVIRQTVRKLKENGSTLFVVDALLTQTWPKDVHMLSRFKDAMIPISAAEKNASRDVAEIANAICPRYHVVPSSLSSPPENAASDEQNDQFFEREPYRNVSAKHATRFISLASVGNAKKQKWLHALGIEPGGTMNPIKLCQMPPDSTPSPYAMAGVSSLQQRGGGGGGGGNQQNLKRELKPDWRDNADVKKKQRLEESQTRALAGDADKTIHVRNLDYRADEGAIAEFFGECGELADLRLGRDLETGRSRGFCKIAFKTKEGVEAALERDQQNFYGRDIRVQMDRQQQLRQYDVENNKNGAYDPNKRKPPPPPVSCWFCLSNNKDTHMIASIGNASFVAMDKGGLNPEHAQIVPIEHIAAFSMLPDDACEEVWSYLQGFRKFAEATEDRGVVAFERHLTLKNKGGNHMHLNVVPIPSNRKHLSKKIFEQAAKRCDFTWDIIAPEHTQNGIAARIAMTSLLSFPEAEYYAVHLPDGTILITEVKQYDKHWMQFGREVISHLLKTPETANWQSVVQDEDGEIERTNAFKESFKPFDPVMEAEEGDDE